MLAGLEFATEYLDDTQLRSENNKQHRKHNMAAIQKMDEYDFKLGSEKCEFFMKQIKYSSQIIGKNGRKTDPEKAVAIKNMPSPNNVFKAWPTIIVSTFLKCMIVRH